jgi:hypothetical protein
MSLSRRVFVLVLGAFLALGMSLPVVQAGSMPAKMSMSASMGMSGHCQDCGGKSGSAKEIGGCSWGCVAPVLAVVPQSSPTRLEHIPVPVLPQDSLPLGRAFSPDPDPPRSHDLG